MFTTHKNNLYGIKAAVAAHGTVWFHGDGNIYHKKEDSDFRKGFSNDAHGPHTYRVQYGIGGLPVPDSLDEVHKHLQDSKNKEAAESRKPVENTSSSSFKVDIPEDESGKVKKNKKAVVNSDQGSGE